MPMWLAAAIASIGCSSPPEVGPPTEPAPPDGDERSDVTTTTEPLLWASAQSAQGGIFSPPAGWTGTEAVDRVMLDVPLASASVSWDRNPTRAAFGSFQAGLASGADVLEVARRMAAAAGSDVVEGSHHLIVAPLDVTFSRGERGWTFVHYARVPADVAEVRARELWAQVAAARAFDGLRAAVGAELESVTVRAGPDGEREIVWFGSRDGWAHSDGVIAAARSAGLRTPRLEEPLRAGEEIAVDSGFEGRSADGYELEVGITPSVGASGTRTELQLRVARGAARRPGG